jgi:tetratricopeptide (TPR) repeat protein
VESYYRRGLDLVQADTFDPDELAAAVAYFREVLALDPRHRGASVELEVALLVEEGRALFHEGLWDEAIPPLRHVYEKRREYLGGIVEDLLYEAYLQSGDDYHEAGEFNKAYEQYSKAAELLVLDELFDGRPPCPLPPPTPALRPAVEPPSESACRERRGLASLEYLVSGAPGPFSVGEPIGFTFGVANTTEQVLSYQAIGTWVEETGQFQQTWTCSVLTPGETLADGDHIAIAEAGTYRLWLGVVFADDQGELLCGPVEVEIR